MLPTNSQETGNEIAKEDSKMSDRLLGFLQRFMSSPCEIMTLEKFQKEFIDQFFSDVTVHSEELDNLKIFTPHLLHAFHSRYQSLKWPIQYPWCLDKMSRIVAFCNDLKFQQAKDLKSTLSEDNERLVEVANQVLTSLFIYLEKSFDHILDAILYMKCMTDSYKELAVIVLRRVLKDAPPVAECLTYYRLVLVYRLWVRLSSKNDEDNVQARISELRRPPRCLKHADPIEEYWALVKDCQSVNLVELTENKQKDESADSKRIMIRSKAVRAVQNSRAVDSSLTKVRKNEKPRRLHSSSVKSLQARSSLKECLMVQEEKNQEIELLGVKVTRSEDLFNPDEDASSATIPPLEPIQLSGLSSSINSISSIEFDSVDSTEQDENSRLAPLKSDKTVERAFSIASPLFQDAQSELEDLYYPESIPSESSMPSCSNESHVSMSPEPEEVRQYSPPLKRRRCDCDTSTDQFIETALNTENTTVDFFQTVATLDPDDSPQHSSEFSAMCNLGFEVLYNDGWL